MGGHWELVRGGVRWFWCRWSVRQPVPEGREDVSEPWTEDGVNPLSPCLRTRTLLSESSARSLN